MSAVLCDDEIMLTIEPGQVKMSLICLTFVYFEVICKATNLTLMIAFCSMVQLMVETPLDVKLPSLLSR